MSGGLPFTQRACLVAGSAKSGTTLLVALLDGHPQLLAIPEETAYFPTVRRKYRAASRLRQAEYLMEEAESRLLFEREEVDRGNRDYRSFPRHELRSEFLRRVNDPARMHDDLLALLAESLAVVTRRAQDSIRWWIEKTPANRWCVPDIRGTFPQARLLLTMRDPRAVASAILKRGARQGFKKYSFYLVAKYWVQSAKLVLAEQGHPMSLCVRFEQMLREPESVMRGIAEFLEIDWDDVLLRPTKGGVPWRGNSTGGERFESVSTAPVDRWKTELPRAELEFVESLCAPWMMRLGYEPMLPAFPRAKVIWRKYACETWSSYLKDRRRYLGDLLVGFWK